MPLVNEHFLNLKAGYLFPEIARRVKAFQQEHPEAKIIRMGIGDVTEPLPLAIVRAMHKAVDEMGVRETFRGYGPEQGYDFLRDAIVKNDFHARGCDVAADEIFVSDGSKSDCGNILDILGRGNVIAVTDPVYPVYVDTNVMIGNAAAPDERGEYTGLVYLRGNAENNFTPEIPKQKVDVIYLCSPNNPTGTVIERKRLTEWVNYAREHKSVIFFDAAYEAYIDDGLAPSPGIPGEGWGEGSGAALNSQAAPGNSHGGTLSPALSLSTGRGSGVPHSIFEIPGARDCAIEFRSFSKTAGFTGVRAAFTVVPKSVKGRTKAGEQVDFHRLWYRRHTTRNNGISYIQQRGCEAVYSEEGKQQVRDLVNFYKGNARIIREKLESLGMKVFGATHAPYAWVQTPCDMKSWDYFDKLLTESHVVVTPGSGFGLSGEGFIRISAFNSRANVEEAMRRIAAHA